MSKEKVFWFAHESRVFFRVHAVDKEGALTKLLEAQDKDLDHEKSPYYDRTETEMDFTFVGSQKYNEWGEKEWERD